MQIFLTRYFTEMGTWSPTVCSQGQEVDGAVCARDRKWMVLYVPGDRKWMVLYVPGDRKWMVLYVPYTSSFSE